MKTEIVIKSNGVLSQNNEFLEQFSRFFDNFFVKRRVIKKHLIVFLSEILLERTKNIIQTKHEPLKKL